MVDIQELDLGKLFSGKTYTLQCSLSFNNQIVKSVSVLPDTGASGFAYIDSRCAKAVAKWLGQTPIHLGYSIQSKGFDGKKGPVISKYILLSLWIDDRRLDNLPFLIVELGTHDIILGSRWLAHYDILIDSRQRRLIWPSHHHTTPRFSSPICTHLSLLMKDKPKILKIHQKDVERRDKLQKKEDQSFHFGACSKKRPVHTKKSLHRNSSASFYETATSNRAINEHDSCNDNNSIISNEEPHHANKLQLLSTNKIKSNESCSIDICEISAPAFHLNLVPADNIFFSISLHAIEQELENRTKKSNLDDCQEDIDELLNKVPEKYHDLIDVFSKSASNVLPPHRLYDHKIVLENHAQPTSGPLYPMSEDQLKAVHKYLLENLDKGFIEPSKAPFSSPVLFVKKSDGSLRFCIDFRKLNALTRKDRYPLPLIDETLARLNKAKIYSKLDIRQAFHRIRMHPDSEELTTFRTRYGSYKCKVLPFGLTNGPATYQRYMNDILLDYLDVFCTAYLDDILIYSENEIDHKEHVRKVLMRLQHAGLQADIKKCEFDVTKTRYLGFIISTKGLMVDPDKISVVKSWAAPKTIKGIQSFLGFCNFYRRFIANFGRIARPLINLTKKGATFDFDLNCHKAFKLLKNAMTSAPLLSHYNPERYSRLETDASDGVVAAVLSQKDEQDNWHPVAFFSKTMQPAELNYEVHDKEMLAIIRGLDNWRAELQGSPHKIEIVTDHRALEYFMTSKNLTARQARWSEILSQFFFQIMYRPGRQNASADALSRREQDTNIQDEIKREIRYKPLIQNQDLSEEVVKDLNVCFLESFKVIDAVLAANKSHESLQDLRQKVDTNEHLSMDDGILFFKDRLVVPMVDNVRTELIRQVHDQLSNAHAGRNKTYQELISRYFWNGMRKDVERYCRNCHLCRTNHAARDKTPGLLHPLPVPDRPWQHICVDYMDMPRDKKGFDKVVVFIDRFSKVSVTLPCKKDVTARDTAELYFTYVYRYYDLPDSIVSDRGAQFISAFWKYVMDLLGVELRLSTAYSPQTDGQTEIMNQYITHRLRPFIHYYQDNWSDLLPAMDNAQLTLPHDSIGMSPFELSRGYTPRKSYDWKKPVAPKNAREILALEDAKAFAAKLQETWKVGQRIMRQSQARMTVQANKHRREPDFDVNDRVYLSSKNLRLQQSNTKLSPKFLGPFKILSKQGYSYKLDTPKQWSNHNVFHARYLRKAADDPLPGQILPQPDPVNIVGDDEWEVDKILDVKLLRNKLKYCAKWLGWDDDPQYYPASNFKTAPNKLMEFHLEHQDKPGPPKYLLEWLNAWKLGIDNYNELDDDSPMPTSLRTSFFQRGG